MVRDLDFYSFKRQYWPAALREREIWPGTSEGVVLVCEDFGPSFRAHWRSSFLSPPPPFLPIFLSLLLCSLARSLSQRMTLSLALAMSRSLARAFSLFEEDDIVRKTTFNPSAQKKKTCLPPSYGKGFDYGPSRRGGNEKENNKIPISAVHALLVNKKATLLK